MIFLSCALGLYLNNFTLMIRTANKACFNYLLVINQSIINKLLV